MRTPTLILLVLAGALTVFAQGDPAHEKTSSSKPLVSFKLKWPTRAAQKDNSSKTAASPAPSVGNSFTVGADYLVAINTAGDSKKVGNSKTVGGDPAPESDQK